MSDLDRTELEKKLREHPLVAARLRHERDAQAAEAAIRECIYGEPIPISSWLRSSTCQQVKLAFSQIRASGNSALAQMRSTELPVGVGDREAQARFIANNRDFLFEHPLLRDLLEKVGLRTLEAPPQEEVERLLKLPEDDPTVIAFEDKVMADRVVFGLGRIVADDFGEVLTLSGNGRGIGAYKILRGMYERLVTAAYIAKNPSDARPFVEDDVIKKWKLWQQAVEVMPDLKNSVSSEKIEALEAEYKRVKAKRAESICKKCGQPKTQEEWTRVDLASMAKQADINLSVLYGACYLTPTFHSHATGFGLSARFKPTEQGSNAYQETSEKEARQAILLAHNLVLRHLTLQNEYFKLGLEAEIQPCIDAFLRIWKQPAASPRVTGAGSES
jgi:hypothetical protein